MSFLLLCLSLFILSFSSLEMKAPCGQGSLSVFSTNISNHLESAWKNYWSVFIECINPQNDMYHSNLSIWLEDFIRRK